MINKENTELLDTLYNGLNGELYSPNFKLHPELPVSDVKQSQNKIDPPPEIIYSQKEDYEIVPTHEVFAATVDEEFDIRPIREVLLHGLS